MRVKRARRNSPGTFRGHSYFESYLEDLLHLPRRDEGVYDSSQGTEGKRVVDEVLHLHAPGRLPEQVLVVPEPVGAEPLFVDEQAKRDDVGDFRHPAHRDRVQPHAASSPGAAAPPGQEECATASGPRTTGLPVRDGLPRNLPWQTNRCMGDTTNQYRIPPSPFGTKHDRCSISTVRWPIPRIRKARTAQPGRAISATSTGYFPGDTARTLQKSTGSPGPRADPSLLPRRIPTPPASRSRIPRSRQSQSAKYHPASPPIRPIRSHASSGVASRPRRRWSWNDVPPP